MCTPQLLGQKGASKKAVANATPTDSQGNTPSSTAVTPAFKMAAAASTQTDMASTARPELSSGASLTSQLPRRITLGV